MEIAASTPSGSAKTPPELFVDARTLVSSTGSWAALVDMFVDAFNVYGDTIHLTGIPLTYNMFIFRNPEHLKEIFSHESIGVQKRHQEIMAEKIKFIMGHGTFIHPGGPEWERNRRMIDPGFYRAPLMMYATAVAPSAQLMLDRWEERAQKRESFDVHYDFRVMVIDLTFKGLFSIDLGEKAAEVHELSHFTALQFDYKPPLMVPTERNKTYKKVVKRLQNLIDDIIAERRKKPTDAKDCLSYLLEAKDKETNYMFTDVEVRDEVFSIYLGAYVAGAALAWTFYLLSQHPAVSRELEKEVDTELQGKIPTVADLSKLKWPLMVFNEAARIFPPAWMMTRYSQTPNEIGGYKIPGNSILLCPAYFAHRHPDYWENPEAFDPLRFSPENRRNIHRYAFFPFAAGPRMCMGHQLATMICQLVIVQVVQRYRLEFAPLSPREPEKHFGFELEPKDHLMMRARTRPPVST